VAGDVDDDFVAGGDHTFDVVRGRVVGNGRVRPDPVAGLVARVEWDVASNSNMSRFSWVDIGVRMPTPSWVRMLFIAVSSRYGQAAASQIAQRASLSRMWELPWKPHIELLFSGRATVR